VSGEQLQTAGALVIVFGSLLWLVTGLVKR
jgi:hypothetical protein